VAVRAAILRSDVLHDRGPRLLIDASTYAINNNGDMAMFKVLLGRLRARFPDARVAIVTNDPDGVKTLDPRVEPVVVGDRWLWERPVLGVIGQISIQPGEHAPVDAEILREAASRIATRLQRAAPDRYWQLVADLDPVAGRGGRRWQHLLDTSDAVLLTGGGYFTDAFANHAVQLLSTLDAGLQRRLPAFIVGCGFEPIEDRALRRIGRAVLPRVTVIACREGVTSPGVLRAFGVEDGRVSVTGDDAVEFAYVRRPPGLGSAIGLSLRDHIDNQLNDVQYAALREVVQRFANEQAAPILPMPISNTAPRDLDAIERLLPGIDVSHALEIASLQTPEGVIAPATRCRIVLTGSYHAAVFALSMGIPAVCVTRSEHYELKMHGLLAQFDAQPDARVISLDDPDLARKLHAALVEAWDHADDDRPSLLAAAAAQVERGRATYERILDEIDAAVSARCRHQAEATAAVSRAAPDTDDLALMSVVEHRNAERRRLHASHETLTRALAAKDALTAALEVEATARLDKLVEAHAAIAEKEAMVAQIAHEAALRLQKLDAAHAILEQQQQKIDHLHRQIQEKEAIIQSLAHEAEQRRMLLQRVTDALQARQSAASHWPTAEA
jgi:polysaccharide pyruvyl transferase WcaK-like protein